MSRYSKAYQNLRHDMCVDLGFCGSARDGELLHIDDLLPLSGEFTAEDFVRLAFQAERSTPNYESEKTKRVISDLQSLFVMHLGDEKVRAEALFEHSD